MMIISEWPKRHTCSMMMCLFGVWMVHAHDIPIFFCWKEPYVIIGQTLMLRQLMPPLKRWLDITFVVQTENNELKRQFFNHYLHSKCWWTTLKLCLGKPVSVHFTRMSEHKTLRDTCLKRISWGLIDEFLDRWISFFTFSLVIELLPLSTKRPNEESDGYL